MCCRTNSVSSFSTVTARKKKKQSRGDDNNARCVRTKRGACLRVDLSSKTCKKTRQTQLREQTAQLWRYHQIKPSIESGPPRLKQSRFYPADDFDPPANTLNQKLKQSRFNLANDFDQPANRLKRPISPREPCMENNAALMVTKQRDPSTDCFKHIYLLLCNDQPPQVESR